MNNVDTNLSASPYIIDHKVLQRFDQRRTIFGRRRLDTSFPFYNKNMYERLPEILCENKAGYTYVDFARAHAAWTVYDHFTGAFSAKKLEETDTLADPKLKPYERVDAVHLTDVVKETARRFGASAVGICTMYKKWIYSHALDGTTIDIPPEYQYAIVLVIAMDAEEIARSPSYVASIENGLGYSRTAACCACLAQFLRNLGYGAIPAGNDIALSIPLAIDAGMGELGRNGLLITPEYGPCVRLAKILTDMPLVADQPVEFGVHQFCETCNRCVEACEASAIQENTKPSYRTQCLSNNDGIVRWAVNHDKCYDFWVKNGNDCSNCIAACPFDPRGSSASHTRIPHR